MKVVILAGGRGLRLSEFTDAIPKPMIDVGGKPIIEHIMQIYADQGQTDFIILGGYKIRVISDWLNDADLPWQVELLDTGVDTMTGGRIAKAARHLGDRFHLTYGDGLANVELPSLTAYHEHYGGYCTVTAVHPLPRFGELELSGAHVTRWSEKKNGSGWISGGFYVCQPDILDYIYGDEPFESGACTRMVKAGVLTAFRHEGYWQCCDTLKDVATLRDHWKEVGAWTG